MIRPAAPLLTGTDVRTVPTNGHHTAQPTSDQDGFAVRQAQPQTPGSTVRERRPSAYGVRRTRGHGSIFGVVSEERRLLTARDLDAMSPDQRAAGVSERIVTDLDELPAEYRRRMLDTDARLAAERRTPAE